MNLPPTPYPALKTSLPIRSRKEDLASRPPTQSEPTQAPAAASAESDWNGRFKLCIKVDPTHVDSTHVVETMNESIRTEHTGQPFSTIREILDNPSVPNRFRLKARASAIRPIGKNLGDMIIKWCLECSRRSVSALNWVVSSKADESSVFASFKHEYCTKCKDKDLLNAEYRYRFWAILQDEPDGPKLPCQMEHQSIVSEIHRNAFAPQI